MQKSLDFDTESVLPNKYIERISYRHLIDIVLKLIGAARDLGLLSKFYQG